MKLTVPQQKLLERLKEKEWRIQYNQMSDEWEISSSFLSRSLRTEYLQANAKSIVALIEAGHLERIGDPAKDSTCHYYRLTAGEPKESEPCSSTVK